MRRWEKAVANKWGAGATHAFFLHLNVQDQVWNEDTKKFASLTEHIVSSTVAKDACFVAIYNRADGVHFPTEEMEVSFLKFLAELYPAKNSQNKNIAVEEFKADRRKLSYALAHLSEMLQISTANPSKSQHEAMEAAGLGEWLSKKKTPFFAVILEYIETICPTNSATTSHEQDRNAVVTLQVWAKSAKIAAARNIVFLLGAGLNMVAPELRSETNGVVPLKIDFPDLGDRLETIGFWRDTYKRKDGDLDDMQFAHLSAGMSRVAIRNVIKEADLKKIPITTERIFDQKKKYIESQSGGLLEILQPAWGVEVIGGLRAHKDYIEEVVSAMKEGNRLAVPMGVLLLGAPGTGKTVFAEAIAHEAGLPFVRMKNIREMWVGQSERNLDLALELIRAQAPVVVFVDEVDQQYQSRSSMGDNTGVNNRMQAEIFQFMSDTNLRGRVLWVAASNRPDLMDPAMLREGRFDEKIPFFPPDAKERGEILLAIFEKMKGQAKIQKGDFFYEVCPEFAAAFGRLTHWHVESDGIRRCKGQEEGDFHDWDKEEGKTILGLTGAQIEKIVNDAYKIASRERLGGKTVLLETHLRQALLNYLPPHDFARNALMTDQAILHCTSERFIPEGKWRKQSSNLRSQSGPSKVNFG